MASAECTLVRRRRAAAAIGALLALTGFTPDARAAGGLGLRRRLDAMRERLDDWPQLARYRAENAALPRPAPGEARVVFIGDSITDYWGREAGVFFPGRPYLNRGIAGQTTPQILLRLRPDALALQPRAIVVLAGTNDLAANAGATHLAQARDNLATMTHLARAAGVRVVMASLLPVHDHAQAMSATRAPREIVAMNRWIEAHMRRERGTYLDYHGPMVGADGMLRRELSDDGLHPNAAGYAVMQPLAQRQAPQAQASASAQIERAQLAAMAASSSFGAAERPPEPGTVLKVFSAAEYAWTLATCTVRRSSTKL